MTPEQLVEKKYGPCDAKKGQVCENHRSIWFHQDSRCRAMEFQVDMLNEYRDDLRAKVEALRDEAMDHNWADAIVAYQTMLALIDGGGDD